MVQKMRRLSLIQRLRFSLAGVLLLVVLANLAVVFIRPKSLNFFAMIGILWLTQMGACIWGILAERALKRKAASRGYKLCPFCGYDLSGSPETGCCPECGEPYETEDVIDWWRDLGIASPVPPPPRGRRERPKDSKDAGA
jgi:hypothetical protein